MALPLDPPTEQKRQLLDAAVDRVLAWMEALPGQRVAPTADVAARAEQLRWDPPAAGRDMDDVFAELFEHIVPSDYNIRHPGFMAYIPHTAIWSAAVADLLTDALDRYATVRVAGPAAARVEDEVVRWFTEWVGMPVGSGGLLTSGGSLANLHAFVAAREAAGEQDLRRLRWYGSGQMHHSNHKAARIAGLPDECLTIIHGETIDLEALAFAIEADREAGLVPFMVVGNAGTTDTGAIDDLAGIAATARDQGIWFHVDAAYGGFFALSPRCQGALRGMGQADSVTLDPHKGLGLPFGVGTILVRDPSTLLAANRMRGAYMPVTGVVPDATDMGLELSRAWRGLRVWIPIMLHGVDAFRGAIERSMDLAADAAVRLGKVPGVQVRGPPSLSAFAFRKDGESAGALLQRINADGRVFLSSTRLDDGDWVRVCVLNATTGPEQIDALLEIVRADVA